MPKNIEKHMYALVGIGGYTIEGPTSLRPEFESPGALGFIITRFFAFLLPLFGIIGFLFLIYSGFQFLMSKGDPKAIEAAKMRMTYTVIGLIIIFMAYMLTEYILSIFNINTDFLP